jgi:hypothetical protein
MLNVYNQMLLIENILKAILYNIIDINFANFIRDILRDNPIVRSYDKIQNVIILDLDLIEFYLNFIRDEI